MRRPLQLLGALGFAFLMASGCPARSQGTHYVGYLAVGPQDYEVMMGADDGCGWCEPLLPPAGSCASYSDDIGSCPPCARCVTSMRLESRGKEVTSEEFFPDDNVYRAGIHNLTEGATLDLIVEGCAGKVRYSVRVLLRRPSTLPRR